MFDSPAVITCFDDIAVMRNSVEQGCGHFLVTKDCGPFTKGEIGSDDDRSSLIQMREQMKDDLANSGLVGWHFGKTHDRAPWAKVCPFPQRSRFLNRPNF